MEETLVPLNDAQLLTPESRRNSNSSFGSDKDINLQEEGQADTLDYRIHAKHGNQNKTISLWHDISLSHIDPDSGEKTEYFNFVCEIPKFTRYETQIKFRQCHRDRPVVSTNKVVLFA